MSKITAIETIHPSEVMPNLMLLRIHTDDGVIGHGETYFTPEAIAALIHDWMARRLIGADALARACQAAEAAEKPAASPLLERVREHLEAALADVAAFRHELMLRGRRG